MTIISLFSGITVLPSELNGKLAAPVFISGVEGGFDFSYVKSFQRFQVNDIPCCFRQYFDILPCRLLFYASGEVEQDWLLKKDQFISLYGKKLQKQKGPIYKFVWKKLQK